MLQHPRRIKLIVVRLQFGIWETIIGMVIDIVTCFQYEGLYVLGLNMYKYAVIKVSVVSIQENYYIVDRGGTAYGV